MSKQIFSSVRLRRAVASVVEKLEDRRLMAADPSIVQTLPFSIEFDTDRGGVLDKDGQGTGFTDLQSNTAGDQYQPSLIDLDTTNSLIKITAKGTATAGSNFNGDNTLKNALMTRFDASAAGGFTMTVRLKGPLNTYTLQNNQAGLMFGADQDNYVKLVAINDNGKNYVQFIDEQTTGTTYTHQIAITNSLYNVGVFDQIQSLDLIMVGDPATGKISAFYRVNEGALTKIGAELTLSGAKKAQFFSSNAQAGITAMKKANGADFTATFDRFEITAGTPLTNRPSVVDTRPGDTDTGVSPDSFIAVDINLPTPGKGVDANTLSSDSVRLFRTSDHSLVTAVLNTDGAGGSIVLQPTANLDANTSYTFEITDALKDTSGAAFIPYTMTFTTGNLVAQPDSSIAFEKISLPTAAGQKFTGVTMGPDGKLYASTDSGDIYRWALNADGTLGAAQVITTVKTNNGGPRLISGITFDPTSTASNLILWVDHSYYAQENASDFSGKISRLSGVNLDTYQDYVVNLPRSIKDHTTNQPSFGPDGKLYFQQGAMTAMGAPDNAWGLRSEHMLSAAVLQVDTAAIAARISAGQGPLDVKTPDAGGTYDPFAASAAVKLYATGIRNAYDLIWHSNGHLYAPTNGSAAGGALPATPTTPAVAKNNQTQDDWLFDVVQGDYYGHPNPSRNELYAYGGNPTNATDPFEVAAYPVGTTQPAANYATPAYTFGKNYSPNGAIEYKSNTFNGALKGKLLVTRYSGGDDILVLDVNADGSIGAAQTGIAGLTHFTDPLDLTENTANGFLYVAEYGGAKITLLRPITPGANVSVDKTTYYFNDVRTDSVAGPTQFVTITNTGTQALALTSDGLTISGTDAAQFVFVNKPSLPTTIQPGQTLKVGVAMKATSVGVKTATLTIKSNDPDQPIMTLSLRGLGTNGTGGANEPSLQMLLNLYNIPINTGDSNPATTDLYTTTEPLGASDEVTGMQRLVKAGAGPITITPLAVMGVSSNPAFRFGYYEAGTGANKTELFSVPTADAQSVNPTLNGITSFDPGAKAFGLYTTWPAFKAADNVNLRDVYSEDALNTPWDSASPHKARFYQMKNADGSIVPNTYVVAWEEFNAGFDSNDFVAIISNVQAAPAGAEIGWDILDNTGNLGVGIPNRMVFNRIGINNPTIGDTVHDTSILRIKNTGSQDLVINSITASSGWTVLNTPTTPIAPGGFYDVSVKFVATGTVTGSREGTLSIQSNDLDEPTATLTLAGIYQSQSENNVEPKLQQFVDLFGYSTQVIHSGQTFNSGGLVEAVGDEILSQYWTRADSQQSVQVRQLAAFHTQGNTSTFGWFNKGSNSVSNLFTQDNHEGQSILPHKSGTNFTQPAYGTFSTANTFGFRLDGYWTDDTKNAQSQPGGNYGHYVRIYPAKDGNGNVIANTYIVTMDYSGINFDYQDNIYLISNIKPEGPAAVTGLTATGGGTISLAWNANNPNNLAGYNVYRSTTANGTYTKINNSVVTATNYTDATAPAGVTSFYRVVAIDNFGTESAAASASAVRTVDTTPPVAPTGLTAVGSSSGVSLTWTPNVETDLTGYNIYRSDSANGTFIKLNGAAITTASYNDANAPAGVASFYRVTAVDTSNNESAAATANATRLLDTTPPAAPTGVIATGSVSGISLDWVDNAEADLAGYNVYRSDSANGTFQKLNGAALLGSFYSDTGAPAGVTTYYRITAVDSTGNESAFATGSAVRIDGVAPAAPTGLVATAISNGISLDWTNNTEADLAGYNVFRSDSANGTYVKINASLLTSSDFVDTQAPVGSTSYYYVVAVDTSANVSSTSAVANATRPSAQQTIRTNAAGLTYTDTLGQTWSPAGTWSTSVVSNTVVAIANTTDDALYYNRRYGADFTYNLPVSNGTYTLKLYFTETAYSANNKRVFSVQAEGSNILTNFDIYKDGGAKKPVIKTFTVNIADGALDLRFFSSIENAIISAVELVPVSVTPTPPAAPTGLTATAVSTSQINLAWADNANNETGYLIERSTDGTNFTTVTTAAAGATTYSDTTLAAGTQYFYRVTAVGSPTNSAASNIANATTQAAPTAPAAPTGLVASTISTSAINLSWTDNATNETGYLVERSTDGTNFTTVTTVAAGSTSYGDTGLAAGTQYFYRVTALGSSLNSTPSNVANATTQTAPTAPAAPTNLAASAISTSAINLTWVDNATNETGYLIERSINGTTFTIVTTVAAGSTSYGDTGLAAGTQYFYRVTAVGASLNSAPSNVANATTQTAPTAPAAPTNLAASAVSSSAINLTWVDNATTETGYLIERSTDGTNFTTVTTVAAGSTSYGDTNLSASTQYFYRVTAVGTSLNSAPSNVANATTQTPSSLTTIRTNAAGLTYTDTLGQTWSPVGTFSASTVSNAVIAIANTNDDPLYYNRRFAQDFTYNAAVANGSYTLKLYFTETFYTTANSRVFSVQAEGTQIITNLDIYKEAGTKKPLIKTFNVNITDGSLDLRFFSTIDNAIICAIELTPVAGTPTTPATPTALTATPQSSSQVKLDWTDNATNETGYRVERSTDGTNFTAVTTLAANAITYTDTGLTAGATYQYRVIALGTTTNSAASNVASVTTVSAIPTAPSGLVATALSSTSASLSWTDNSANETGFMVERSTNGTTFSLVVTVGANTTTFTDTGLTGSTQYFYRVTAVGSAGNSTPSSVATTTTLTTLRVNAAGTTFVDAAGKTWSADTGFSASTADNRVLAVNNTTDDELYYNRRYAADFTFTAPVVNGTYTLNLYFIETFYTANNKRVFSVQAEGNTIVSNLDLYKTAGIRNPVVKTATVTITDGQLDLRFFSSIENAIISAIELTPVSA